jgi:hypothetical protein
MAIRIAQGGSGPNFSSVAGTSIVSPGPNIFLLLTIGYVGMFESFNKIAMMTH